MPDAYPPPSYAAQVWFNGTHLCVALPPSAEGGRHHTIMLPIEKCAVETSTFGGAVSAQSGWQVLLELLKERNRAGRRQTIGHASEPVQHDIEHILRAVTAPGGASKSIADLAVRYDRKGQPSADDVWSELGI